MRLDNKDKIPKNKQEKYLNDVDQTVHDDTKNNVLFYMHTKLFWVLVVSFSK